MCYSNGAYDRRQEKTDPTPRAALAEYVGQRVRVRGVFNCGADTNKGVPLRTWNAAIFEPTLVLPGGYLLDLGGHLWVCQAEAMRGLRYGEVVQFTALAHTYVNRLGEQRFGLKLANDVIVLPVPADRDDHGPDRGPRCGNCGYWIAGPTGRRCPDCGEVSAS